MSVTETDMASVKSCVDDYRRCSMLAQIRQHNAESKQWNCGQALQQCAVNKIVSQSKNLASCEHAMSALGRATMDVYEDEDKGRSVENVARCVAKQGIEKCNREDAFAK